MTVGQQANSTIMDQTLTNLAIQVRDLMERIHNLNTQVNGQGNGLAYLEGIGYDAGSAATAQTLINYFANIQGIYFGQIPYGDPPAAVVIDTVLSVLWGGQV